MFAEAGLCQPDAVRLLHLHPQPGDQLTGKKYWSVLLCQERLGAAGDDDELPPAFLLFPLRHRLRHPSS